MTSNILPNSTYYEYPPRGWDAYILAFNFGAIGSSPGSALHKISVIPEWCCDRPGREPNML